MWKPTVTAVNGMVAGAGFHFVVDADIVVAAEHAIFVDTHVNVGMVGAIENIGLAKRLPLGTALRMTLCGKAVPPVGASGRTSSAWSTRSCPPTS